MSDRIIGKAVLSDQGKLAHVACGCERTGKSFVARVPLFREGEPSKWGDTVTAWRYKLLNDSELEVMPSFWMTNDKGEEIFRTGYIWTIPFERFSGSEAAARERCEAVNEKVMEGWIVSRKYKPRPEPAVPAKRLVGGRVVR